MTDSREYSNLDDDVWNSFWSTQYTLPVDELSFEDSDMTALEHQSAEGSEHFRAGALLTCDLAVIRTGVLRHQPGAPYAPHRWTLELAGSTSGKLSHPPLCICSPLLFRGSLATLSAPPGILTVVFCIHSSEHKTGKPAATAFSTRRIPPSSVSFTVCIGSVEARSSDLNFATSRDNVFDYSAAATEINPSNAIGLINGFDFNALQQQQPASFADASLVGQVSQETGGAVYPPLHDDSPAYQQQVLYGYTDLEALTSALGPAFNDVNSLADAAAALSIDVAAPISATQSPTEGQAVTQDYHERVLFYITSGLDLVTASILAGGLVPQTIDPALLQTATAHDFSPAASPSASSSSLTTPTSFSSDMPLSLGPSDLPIAFPLQSGFSPLASPPPTTCSSPSSPRKRKARHPAPPSPGNIKLDRETWEIFHSMKRDATDASGKTSCPVPGCHKQTAKFCASQFQRHMRSHCADFCFDCSFCGKELSRRDSLKRHKCPALR
ncbi:hypothetical protein EXIGLDRAFT_701596 [Exidia glandulosa HHB12029]|uniref:C2H2-type domain-containing protein n=1 Tax=Exidia glandulosa HHB12029 TaxID=1314781 RepID=A0A165Q2L4_EXIGL|nr:hypothetical protein EXIGLDRAFT_701596 [Exidia glandulosa HHB12029]